MTFRCSEAAARRGDQLAGTASSVRAFLLVESPGSWGQDALRDSRLPDDVKAWLRAETARAHVRALLVRRVGRTRPGPRRVFAARVDGDRPWVESTTVRDPAEITAIDRAALGAGRSPGLHPCADPLVLVCTHGRHDACCAERGRPLARALAESAPDRVWESSHLGGDRYAGNVLLLPRGLGFGRVEPSQGPALLESLDRGELDLDHFRGRATLPMPAQFAEVALRRRTGELGLDAVVPLGTRRLDPTSLVATFGVAGTTYDVTVRTTLEAPARLTCHALRENPVPRHEVTAITPRP
jgi:hypothetical protein